MNTISPSSTSFASTKTEPLMNNNGTLPINPSPNPISLNSNKSYTNTERIELPAIVHETIRREEVEEIQPIIHREYQRTKIVRIAMPISEREIKPVTFTESGLAEGNTTRNYNGPLPKEYESYLARDIVDGEIIRIEKEPIIIESIRHVIIEEIRPVIHREIIYPAQLRGTVEVNEGVYYAKEAFQGQPSILGYESAQTRSSQQPFQSNWSNQAFGMPLDSHQWVNPLQGAEQRDQWDNNYQPYDHSWFNQRSDDFNQTRSSFRVPTRNSSF